VDLASLACGGVVAAANDAFFGPKDNLILPGDSTHMGDGALFNTESCWAELFRSTINACAGWETRRKRGPGNDWIVVALGRPDGLLRRIELYTTHFKASY
jgi:allantoicase